MQNISRHSRSVAPAEGSASASTIDTSSTIDISVVIPIYNEEDNIGPVFHAVRDELTAAQVRFEILFVDDGSTDKSLNNMLDLLELDPRVRIIRLRCNCGQTIAMRTGIEHARGNVIVTMDGDMQNDPADIMTLVRLLDEGHDLVTGWRADRKDPFLSRKLPSMVANWWISRFLGTRVHDLGCSLKAYRAELIRQVPLYSDFHRFIPVMCTLASTRVAEVKVRHHPRRRGTSKYGIGRTGRVVLDALAVKMLVTCTQRPLHWFGSWALVALFLAFCTGLGAIVNAWRSHAWTLVLPGTSVLLAYLGLHLLSFGLLGEVIARTRPTSRVYPLVEMFYNGVRFNGGPRFGAVAPAEGMPARMST